MSLISVAGLRVDIAGKTVLRDIEFSINTGEIVTIVGPNGSGKTTLLRVLIGALRPSTGKVKRKSGISFGYVPQKLHLDTTVPMSVERFLSLPHIHTRDEANKLLEQVGVSGINDRLMTDLSGGQFQRILLARALLGNPELLLLDEATRGLDQSGIAAFYRLIEKIRSSLHCAVLMISHQLHVVMEASDRVICINGHICCQGTPRSVSVAPEYLNLFGKDARGALALYNHVHDHDHDHDRLAES